MFDSNGLKILSATLALAVTGCGNNHDEIQNDLADVKLGMQQLRMEVKELQRSKDGQATSQALESENFFSPEATRAMENGIKKGRELQDRNNNGERPSIDTNVNSENHASQNGLDDLRLEMQKLRMEVKELQRSKDGQDTSQASESRNFFSPEATKAMENGIKKARELPDRNNNGGRPSIDTNES